MFDDRIALDFLVRDVSASLFLDARLSFNSLSVPTRSSAGNFLQCIQCPLNASKTSVEIQCGMDSIACKCLYKRPARLQTHYVLDHED